MKKVSFIIILVTSVWACTYDNEEDLFKEIEQHTNQPQDTSSTGVSFQADVQPIIQTNCLFPACHAAGAPPQRGDYSTYAGLKIKVDNGKFKEKVIDPPREMPKGRAPLPESEINILKAWLAAGAPNN